MTIEFSEIIVAYSAERAKGASLTRFLALSWTKILRISCPDRMAQEPVF